MSFDTTCEFKALEEQKLFSQPGTGKKETPQHISTIIEIVAYFNDKNNSEDFHIHGEEMLKKYAITLMNQPSLHDSTIPFSFVEYCLLNKKVFLDAFKQGYNDLVLAFTVWSFLTLIHLESLHWPHGDSENLTRKTQISLNLIHGRLYAPSLPMNKLVIDQLNDLERSVNRLQDSRLSWVGYFASLLLTIPPDEYLSSAMVLIQFLKKYVSLFKNSTNPTYKPRPSPSSQKSSALKGNDSAVLSH